MTYINKLLGKMRRWYLKGIVRKMEEDRDNYSSRLFDEFGETPPYLRGIERCLGEGIELVEKEIDRLNN